MNSASSSALQALGRKAKAGALPEAEDAPYQISAIWDVGGKFVYPNDKDLEQYHYRRGFEDCFTDEPNVPFRSIL